jgi:hypothetical protein
MKGVFWIFVVFLIFTSCKEKKKILPQIIPRNEIIPILVDMHIADASLNILAVKQKKFNFKSCDYYYSVLKKYHTDKATFDRSILYYSHDIEEYNKIYDEVLKKLSIIEGNLSNKEIKFKSRKTK